MVKRNKQEEILEYIAGLSVLELSELINEFESTFKVKAKKIEVNENIKQNRTKFKKGSYQKKFLRGC